MTSGLVLCCSGVGLAVLAAGIVLARGEFFAASGLDRLIVLGPAFVAASIAAFGTEHFLFAPEIAQAVPKWMPWHLFWTGFVGAALLAAALSLAAARCVRWSAACLALMFLLFVAMISVPGLVAHPHDRFAWILTLRDSCFSLGALALAATVSGKTAAAQRGVGLRRWMVLIPRLVIGATLVFYGVEHCLYPEFAPGVPLEKMTPAWVPALRLWGYLVGILLNLGGAALLANVKPRLAAAWVGLLMVVITAALYVPIYVLDPPQLKLEGMNYVFDTLMFGGTMLLLAGALPLVRSARGVAAERWDGRQAARPIESMAK